MVPVFFVDNELEAELARGRLESEGIAAQVRFSAGAGYPRYAAGYGGFGIGAPLSTYEVLVAKRHAAQARMVLRVPDRPAADRGRWRVWLLRAFTAFTIATVLYGAWQMADSLF